jgi:DNA-binding transcriptional LysR family regulator
MIDFTSRQLRAFLLVAQHQNFTRAAEALSITPPGLSLLIREFENQLGFRLFDRTTRHVSLTTEGADLIGATRQGLEGFDTALSRVRERVKGSSQNFSIGAGRSVAANILPQAVRDFLIGRSGLNIEVSDDDASAILERVRTCSLDIGLGSFPNTVGIHRTLFYRFVLMVVRADSDVASRRASTTWSALNGQRLILPSFPSLRSTIDQHLARAGVSLRNSMVLKGMDTIVGMAEAGHGIGILPSFVLPACHRRRVGISRLTNPTVPVDFHLIRSRSRKLSASANEFTEFLQSYIARWAWRAGFP